MKFGWSALVRVAMLLLLVAAAVAFTDARVLEVFWNRKLLLGMLSAQPFIVFVTYLAALRFALLVRTPALPVWPVFKSILLANGLNSVLPTRLGELAKPVYLRDHYGIPLSEGLGSVFIERSTDILVLAILALAGASLLFVEPNITFLLAAVAVALAFAFLPKASWLIPTLLRLVPWQRLREFAQRALGHVARKLGEPSAYVSLAIGVVLWAACWLYVTLFIAIAAGRPVDFATGLLVLLATTVGGAVPALPGGLGTYEAAVVAVLKGLGYGFEEALVIAIALHVAQTPFAVIGAAAVLASERIGFASLLRDLRALAAQRQPQ